MNNSELETKILNERLKDLKTSSPSTFHPIDRQLEKLGLVEIKDGETNIKENG